MSRTLYITILTTLGITSAAYAQIPLSNGVEYIQDFNSMTEGNPFPNVYQLEVDPPAGWTFEGNGANVGDGADRAFGIEQTPDASFGAGFLIQVGGTQLNLDISFTGEQWYQSSGHAGSYIDFEYSTDATSLTTGTWVQFDTFDFQRPETLPLGDRSVDGNDPDHRQDFSSIITLTNVPDCSTLWIRWTGIPVANTSGGLRHDGLSVDDFSITANSDSPPPPAESIQITSYTVGPDLFSLTWATTPQRAAVDVYRSTDLVSWGSPIETGTACSSYTDSQAPSPRAFYVVVSSGTPYPPSP